MRLVKIWLLAGIFCLLNCNFGMVEYAALHPQTEKVTQLDSTQKRSLYAPSKEMAVVREQKQTPEETKISLPVLIWSGLKYLTAILLKIITSVL
jgi:hypothetical protein